MTQYLKSFSFVQTSTCFENKTTLYLYVLCASIFTRNLIEKSKFTAILLEPEFKTSKPAVAFYSTFYSTLRDFAFLSFRRHYSASSNLMRLQFKANDIVNNVQALIAFCFEVRHGYMQNINY